MSRTYSFMSPEGKRYAVPRRPWERRARAILCGPSQAPASTRHAHHRAARAPRA
jgi:hypothetical protein